MTTAKPSRLIRLVAIYILFAGCSSTDHLKLPEYDSTIIDNALALINPDAQDTSLTIGIGYCFESVVLTIRQIQSDGTLTAERFYYSALCKKESIDRSASEVVYETRNQHVIDSYHQVLDRLVPSRSQRDSGCYSTGMLYHVFPKKNVVIGAECAATDQIIWLLENPYLYWDEEDLPPEYEPEEPIFYGIDASAPEILDFYLSLIDTAAQACSPDPQPVYD